MNLYKKILFIFIVVNVGLLVRADEEDDFGEFLIDFGSGVAVAACEADETCRSMMVLISIPMFIIFGCLFCFSENDDYKFEPPSTKRMVKVGAGYMVGRQLFH